MDNLPSTILCLFGYFNERVGFPQEVLKTWMLYFKYTHCQYMYINLLDFLNLMSNKIMYVIVLALLIYPQKVCNVKTSTEGPSVTTVQQRIHVQVDI